jgi:hypothetical protein
MEDGWDGRQLDAGCRRYGEHIRLGSNPAADPEQDGVGRREPFIVRQRQGLLPRHGHRFGPLSGRASSLGYVRDREVSFPQARNLSVGDQFASGLRAEELPILLKAHAPFPTPDFETRQRPGLDNLTLENILYLDEPVARIFCGIQLDEFSLVIGADETPMVRKQV